MSETYDPSQASTKPFLQQRQEPQAVVVPPLERDMQRRHGENLPSSARTATVPAGMPAAPYDYGAAILEDARVVKLVDAMVNGNLFEINPDIDFNLKSGYSYPPVSDLLDTSELDTISILQALAENGILTRQLYEKFYTDPDGLFQLVPTERCPRCDSANILKGQLVEHFSCGYVGLDRDFKQESRYVCPKCRKDLRLIGTDYRNLGIHYR